MNKLFVLLLTALLVIPLPATAKNPIRTIAGTVVKVIDGNTISFNSEGKDIETRLYGIDAPELAQTTRTSGRFPRPGQTHGPEAQVALSGKVLNKRVQLDVMDIDRRGMIVTVVRIDGRDINREMVAEGHAWVYSKYLDKTYEANYLRAEEEARKSRRGLWAYSKPHPPWEFRRALKDIIIDGF